MTETKIPTDEEILDQHLQEVFGVKNYVHPYQFKLSALVQKARAAGRAEKADVENARGFREGFIAGRAEGLEKVKQKIESARPTIGEQTLASSKISYSETYVPSEIDKTLKGVLRVLQNDE